MAVEPLKIKIVGGEPLLHPRLESFIEIAKSSCPSSKVCLITNGFFIDRLTAKSWELLDFLTVSLYPSAMLSRDILKYIREEARNKCVQLNWKVQDRFNCVDREELQNYEEAQSVFQKCWIRRRCNTLKAGHFYSCPRPLFLKKLTSSNVRPDSQRKGSSDYGMDSVPLHIYGGEETIQRIQEHLSQKSPFQACLSCNGGNAPLKPHRQLDSRQIREKRDQILSSFGEV